MEVLALGIDYFIWHYTSALRDIGRIFRNVAWFLYHFFSIPILVRTFFAPWKRMNEGYRKGFFAEGFFDTLIVNSLMRVFGMIVRFFVITTGFIVLVSCLILAAAFLICWILAPFLLLLLFALSLRSLTYTP